MKKIITVLCLVSMIVTSAFSVSFADEYTDAQANEFATQLSFYEGTDASANATRAEFAKILCILTDAGYGTYIQAPLADMDSSDKLYPYVSRAISLGYFAAPESGLFKPNDGVYAYQAISTFIDILGYRPVVQSTDYTNDWTYGAKLGLLDSLSLFQMDILTRDQLSVICRNALDVDVMEQRSFGETITYKSTDGRNLLVKYYDAQYVEGVVKANSKTALMAATEIDENEVRIGDVNLKCGATNAETLLGYEVECWYVKDTILYIEKTAQNNIVSIPAVQIDSADKSEVLYTENNKEKKARLSTEADLIYNNSAVYAFDEKLLKPATGYINLLDNNGDGRYDVIFVHEYVNYFVLNVNTTDYRLTDGIRNITVDIDGDKKTSVDVYNYNTSSKSLYPSDIFSVYRKNIVSAEVSLDGENISLIKSDASLSGTVNGIATDAIEPEITIDSVVYKLSGDYAKLINDGSLPKITLGMTGTFYFDYTGSIAYADFTNDGYEYGFMSKAKSEKGLSGKLNIRIFNDEGKWVTYCVEDKIRINNGKKLEPQYAEAELASPQIIKYKKNSDGKITDICTAEDKTSQSGYIGYTENEFTFDFYGKTQKYKSKDRSFNKKYSFELATTDMFIIPTTAYEADGSINEDVIYLADSAYFINDKNYDIKVYDSDEFFIPNVLVVEKASEENYQSRMFLVNKVTRTFDENGDEVCFIVGYLNGVVCKYMYDNDEISQHIKPGDVVRVALSGVGEIRLLEPLASLDPDNTSAVTQYSVNTPGTYGYNTTKGVYIGTAYNVDYKRNTIIAATPSKDTFYKFVGSGAVFWIFDTEEKEFIPTDISAFEGELNSNTPTTICVFDRYLETKDIVAVK